MVISLPDFWTNTRTCNKRSVLICLIRSLIFLLIILNNISVITNIQTCVSFFNQSQVSYWLAYPCSISRSFILTCVSLRNQWQFLYWFAYPCAISGSSYTDLRILAQSVAVPILTCVSFRNQWQFLYWLAYPCAISGSSYTDLRILAQSVTALVLNLQHRGQASGVSRCNKIVLNSQHPIASFAVARGLIMWREIAPQRRLAAMWRGSLEYILAGLRHVLSPLSMTYMFKGSLVLPSLVFSVWLICLMAL